VERGPVADEARAESVEVEPQGAAVHRVRGPADAAATGEPRAATLLGGQCEAQAAAAVGRGDDQAAREQVALGPVVAGDRVQRADDLAVLDRHQRHAAAVVVGPHQPRGDGVGGREAEAGSQQRGGRRQVLAARGLDRHSAIVARVAPAAIARADDGGDEERQPVDTTPSALASGVVASAAAAAPSASSIAVTAGRRRAAARITTSTVRAGSPATRRTTTSSRRAQRGRGEERHAEPGGAEAFAALEAAEALLFTAEYEQRQAHGGACADAAA
jgi:hypothetical protein